MQEYLRGRLHVSWLVAWLSGGFLAGVAAALFAPNLFSMPQSIVIALPLMIIAFTKRLRLMVVLVLLAGVVLGLGRGASVQHGLQAYEPYYGAQVELSGKVSEDTVFGPRGDQRIQLLNIQIADKNLPGKVWVSSRTQLAIKRGDIVTFQGQLREGFGNLPASMFRAQLVHAERPVHGDVAREVRDWFAEKVRVAIPEPEASLGIGYLVGQRSTLPEELDNQLRLLGLTHVVVASGYNLTILVRFARRAFAKRSKYQATAAASAMIFSFVLITGFSPSMSRAALVTGLSLAVWYFGRKIHPFVLLPFSAAVTAFTNPAFVWGDIGWYLSFTAFAGIMILAPLLKHYFFGSAKNLGSLNQIVLETMSAQLATLPIIAFVFGQYSALALPANLLVLPLVPLAMLLTFFAGLGSLLLPGLAAVFGWPASLVLGYMTAVIDTLARLPGAASELHFGLAALVGSYAVLMAVCVLLWHKTGHSFRDDNIVV